jgi:hypothetical protein
VDSTPYSQARRRDDDFVAEIFVSHVRSLSGSACRIFAGRRSESRHFDEFAATGWDGTGRPPSEDPPLPCPVFFHFV